MKFKMNYNSYSPGALNQVIEQSPGKPITNTSNEIIGVIKSAELVVENGLNLIEFEVDGDLICLEASQSVMLTPYS